MSVGTKRGRNQEIVHLIFTFILLPVISSSQPCGDSRCKTGSCDKNGACICNLPDPSTFLDGDRPFVGGKFCDEEQVMCDGTNSFWCENWGTCNEIVQGENYTCKCLPGYTGVHCEYIGASCGEIFCFHEAECLVEGELCGCPLDWKGSVDCSLPTSTDHVVNSTTIRTPNVEARDSNKWFIAVLVIASSLGIVVGIAVFTKKYFRKRDDTIPKFQQLTQMQIHGVLNDDDSDNDVGDSLVPESFHNKGEHLWVE